MSMESSSSSFSSSKGGSAIAWRNQHELSSEHSTESEGPCIVVDGLSSESEDATVSFSSTDLAQKIPLVSLSEQDSIQSSGTEITSEGVESEAEKKRPVTPSTSIVLEKFLEDALSDDGLSKDLFLLKHVRRHRHGFVSLKLLAGYKQAKKMACDWQSLSFAARQSKLLEVNADGRKVRRIAPLPDNLLHLPPSRVLAAVNISDTMMRIETLAATFGKYGNVSSLHLIKHKPGTGIPDALQSLVPSVPEVSHTTCALVQYEDVWGVARALKEFSSPSTTLHAINDRHKQSRSVGSSRRSSAASIVTKYQYHGSCNSTPTARRKNYIPTEWRRRIVYDAQPDSTGSESEEFELKRRMLGIDGRKSRASCPNIGLVNRSLPPTHSLPNSPHTTRKNKGPNVVRDPKGPDGSRGFKSIENHYSVNVSKA